MGRAKLARVFIENQKKRNISFRQKKRTLIKKAREFSILCDVPVCVIVFPFVEGNKKVVQPEIFSYKGEQEPQEIVNSDDSTTINPELGREMINRYLAYPKDFQKSKRSLNLSDVLKDVNVEKSSSIDQDLHNYTNLSKFTNDQLIELLGKLDHKIDSVKSRINVIKNVSKNDGFDAEQQEIEVLSDDDGFLLSDLDIDLDYDAMFEDLKGLTAPDYEGFYNMDMMGVTPNCIEIDQGSRFADNYPLQCAPMMGTTPSPTNNTDNNHGSRFADNYLLECIPMMSTTSTNNTDNNQESRFAGNYPLQRAPMMGTTSTSYTDNNQGFLQCVPMMGTTSTSYTDNNQGSSYADSYPLQCAPMMDTTSTSYTDNNQGSDNYPLQGNSMMVHSIYNNGVLGPQFADNYPLQCNLMMNRSIYNADLGQRFVDNYLLQHSYPMIGHAV
uniref:MADS-box domain-containing protein n=1 Tax=Chenopodium quinoa TaxID=63459 RepID=A0A803MNY3_CHEQI